MVNHQKRTSLITETERTLTIVDSDGREYKSIIKDGKDGKDGVSPTVTVKIITMELTLLQSLIQMEVRQKW